MLINDPGFIGNIGQRFPSLKKKDWSKNWCNHRSHLSKDWCNHCVKKKGRLMQSWRNWCNHNHHEKVHLWCNHHICQKKRLMQSWRIDAIMSRWINHGKKSHLTCLMSIFGQFCQSAHISFNPFLPFSPSTQLPLGFCSKTPLTLYSQETRIPGLRECVGVIIPIPCTLNRTFLGT